MLARLMLVVALARLWQVKAQEACQVSSDNCSCTTANKLTIDLRHIGLKYPKTIETSDGKYRFSYDPCSTVPCGKSTDSVICQLVLSQTVYNSLGTVANLQWNIINSTKFQITYPGGDGGRTTRVTFSRTSSSETTFTFTTETPAKVYLFLVEGSEVAPYSAGGGGGGGGEGNIVGPIGLVLIILSLIALVSYFVIGGIYMYQVKGARGMEVIPNYTFWKDLPFLIKDGFFFMISPCYKKSEKYQSL